MYKVTGISSIGCKKKLVILRHTEMILARLVSQFCLRLSGWETLRKFRSPDPQAFDDTDKNELLQFCVHSCSCSSGKVVFLIAPEIHGFWSLVCADNIHITVNLPGDEGANGYTFSRSRG